MKSVIAGPTPVSGIDRFTRWSTLAAVLLVCAVAGWVSYVHGVSVVSLHGEHGALAHVYPLCIDGLIYSGSMTLLDAARRRVPAPVLGYFMLAAGIGSTVFINVLSGLAYGALGAAIASWPALAVILAYEALMYLVRHGGTEHTQDHSPGRARQWLRDLLGTVRGWLKRSNATVVTHEAESEPEPTLSDEPNTVGLAPESEAQDRTGPTERPTPRVRTRPKNSGRKSPAERAQDKYGELVLSGSPVPSLRTVMTDLGLGQPRAREARDHLLSLVPASNGNGHGESL